MFNNIVNACLLTGFKVSSSRPTISYLQYADDTLIFCDTSEEQIHNLSIFLLCCQLALSLNVNFHKTSIVGIFCSNSLLDSLALILGCKVEKYPLKYLRVCISYRKLTHAAWDPLIRLMEYQNFIFWWAYHFG
ncbi:hypothetical protein AMTRI_Chr08g205460 [Amborella trichopoda]